LFQGTQTDKMGQGVCCELHRSLHGRMRKTPRTIHMEVEKKLVD